MWEYNYSELYHFGIKGMHWGVRRYQNYDGTLTAAGRKRYLNEPFAGSPAELNNRGRKRFLNQDGTLNEKGKRIFQRNDGSLTDVGKTFYLNRDGALTEAGKKRFLNSDGTLNEEGKKLYLNPDGSLTEDGKRRYGAYEVWKNDEMFYKRAAHDGRVDDPELLELLTMETEEYSRYRDKLIADGEEYAKIILDQIDSNAASYNVGSEKYADIKDFSKIRDLGIQEREKNRK